MRFIYLLVFLGVTYVHAIPAQVNPEVSNKRASVLNSIMGENVGRFISQHPQRWQRLCENEEIPTKVQWDALTKEQRANLIPKIAHYNVLLPKTYMQN